jgi:hypothetical protein
VIPTEEKENKVIFQNSYNKDTPTVRFNWNQTGYNIKSFQAKPSTWFQLLKKIGFEITAFYEISPKKDQKKDHNFSNVYSSNKALIIPFTIVMQAKKIL